MRGPVNWPGQRWSGRAGAPPAPDAPRGLACRSDRSLVLAAMLLIAVTATATAQDDLPASWRPGPVKDALLRPFEKMTEPMAKAA